MTKQFEPDVFAAKIYCTDGDGEIVLNEYESHIKGQRHAASVLMPEIEKLRERNIQLLDESERRMIAGLDSEHMKDRITQLEKALEESKAIAQKHEGWLMQEICVRGGLDKKVEGLTKALDLAVKTLKYYDGYVDVSVELREIKKIRGGK
jgi:hypothetical protein